MSVVTLNKERVRQRIADIVYRLMAQEELYQQNLVAEEMVETIFKTVEENNLLETFATISDEDLCDRTLGYYSHSSVGDKSERHEIRGIG